MKGSFGNLLRGTAAAALICLAAFLCCACGGSGSSGGSSGGTGSGSSGQSASAPPVYETDPGDTSTFTLLVYMIGSDLESVDGAATADLREMLAAPHSDRLQILLQTGGALAWQNDMTGRDNTCRRFLLGEEGPELLEELGVVNMSAPESLTEFLQFGAGRCPADRYGLILWDHGAGTLMGYGMDENFESVMLEISDLRQALDASGMHFHFIGFDACLMATMEVAAALEGATDYLIASEETEPSGGWVYTPFLSMLAARPGIAMEELAPRIVDDFVEDPGSTKYDNNTLAVLDLSRLSAMKAAVGQLLKSLEGPLAEDYPRLSLGRSKVRSYGGGFYEQVDLLDLLAQLAEQTGSGGVPETDAAAVREALADLIVYTRSVDSRSGGLAVYFPYLLPDRYEEVAAQMREVGYGEDYFGFFDRFLTTVVAEQERADLQPTAANVRKAPWYRPEEVSLKEETYIDPSTLTVKEGVFLNGELKYIDLKDEQWKLIDQLENVIYVNTEEYGELELGCRNLQHVNTASGDPYYDFDGTWISLENRTVPYYESYYTLNEEEAPYSFGYIPAELDGREISIVVCFSLKGEEEAYIPEILGYRRESVLPFAKRSSVIDISESLRVPDKGVHPFREGDEIRLYAYRRDGSKAYPYDSPILCRGDKSLFVQDETPVEDFAGGRFTSLYQQIALRDIFNNTYLCEGAEISYEWQELAQKPDRNSPGLGPGPERWEGETEAVRLLDDAPAQLRYPSDLFEKVEDWAWGEPALVSRDGKVRVYLEAVYDLAEYESLLDEEEMYALGHDYSLENMTLASGMHGVRILYHEEDGRWFSVLLAGSQRMQGGVYGYRLQVWAQEDPDEEMQQALMYLGNSLEIGE